jgi:RNA polymerase sigma-70 factor (sigma-E family)
MDGTGLVDMRTVAGPERPASFEGLYQAQYGRMLRLAYVLTDDHAVAEELVQDAFVGVYRKWADVEEPVAYLRRAVVNACRSHHRRRFLERRHPPQPEQPVPAHEPDSLWPELRRLSPRRRTALLLRFYEDLSVAEVAQALGCGQQTAKSLIHRGLAQLRQEVTR